MSLRNWLSISQFAKRVGVSPRALRLYEKLGLIDSTIRGANGYRYYRPGGYQWVIRNFRFITGAGLKLVNSADVVVKDNNGNELLREKSDTLGDFVLDASVSYMF